MGLVNNTYEVLKRQQSGDFEKLVFKWRTYALLGAVLITFLTILIWKEQSNYHHFIQGVFMLAYVLVLTGSYWISAIKQQLSNSVTLITIFLTYYTIINAFGHDFNTLETFSFFLILFITSIILENRVLIYLYFFSVSAIITVLYTIIKYKQIETGVPENMILGFTIIFSVLGFFVISNKVKEKEKTESSELFLKNLFNNTYDAILLVDYYSREVVDCNDMALRIFNVKTKNEIVGHKRDRFQVNKMNADQLIKCRQELKESGKWSIEELYRTSDGKEFWAGIVITPLNIRIQQYYIVRLTDISKRKEIELELLRSEKRYRNLFERNLAGVYRTNIDRTIVSANDAFAKILGFEQADEIIGKKPEDIYTTSTDDEVVKQLSEKKKLLSHESKIKLKDGREIWILENTSIAEADDIQGGGQIIEGTVIDITELKKAEQALRHSEQRYRMLFERNLAGVFKISPDGIVLECNDAYAKMLGLNEKKELIGIPMDEFYFSPEERESYTQILNKKESLTNYKLRHKRKDGSELWVLENVSLIKGDDFFGDHLEGTAIDISKLEKATTQLREKEQSISLIINNIDSLVYSVNVGVNYPNHIAFLSDQVEDIVGYKKADIESGQIHLVNYVHKDDIDSIYKGREKLKKTRKKQVFRYRIKHGKTGNYIWLEESVFPQPDRGDGPKNFGLIKDVTERINAEQKLRRSEEKSKQILDNIEEVIYNVSIDESGNKTIEYISPQIETLMGFNKEDYLQLIKSGDIKEHFHRDDWKEIVNKSEQLAKSGQPQELVYRFKPGNADHYKWFEERVVPKFENGRHTGNFGVTRDITARIEADTALRESEKRFKLLADSTLEGIVFSIDKKIIDANDQFAKMHGYKDATEVIGLSIYDFAAEEIHGKVTKYMKQPNPELPMEAISKKKDGSTIYAETKGKDIPVGDTIIRVSVISDISKRKSYEMELERTRENFKRLVEYSPDGIIIQERDKIRYINPAGLIMLGFNEENEVIGKSALSFIDKKYHRKIKQRWDELDQGKEVPFIELRIETEAGLRHIESKPTRVVYEDKPAYQVVLHDISDRKLYEQEQLRAAIAERTNKLLKQEINERVKIEKQLLKNQSYTRQLIDSSLDIIYAVDKRGNITEFNKAAEAIFGYRKEDVLGASSSKLFRSRVQYKKLLDQLFEGKGLFTGEVVCKSSNNEVFFAYLSASILRDEDGKTLGYMAVGRDITEIRNAERELVASEKKYRDLFENATDLIHSVDSKGKIVFVNKSWLENLGYTNKEIVGKPILDFIHPDSKTHCRNLFADLMAAPGSKHAEFAFISKNKQKIEVSGTISVRTQDEEDITTRGMFRNVTKENQNKLIQKTFTQVAQVLTQAGSEKQMFTGVWMALSEIMDVGHFYIALFEPATELVSFVYTVENGKEIDRSTSQRQGEHGLTEYVAKQRKPVVFSNRDLIANQEKNKFKVIGKLPESYIAMPLLIKQKKIGVIAAQNYKDDKIYTRTQTTILEMISTPLALSIQRFRDEATLRASLNEKEVLLKEVHHRVKNNLQIISSILNLQSSYTDDDKILELLQDSQNRIKSMSYIHESLYQTNDFSNISFKNYLQSLSSGLVQSYSLINNPIILYKDLDEVNLNLDQAIPCGLIVNELIINAIKYAFEGKNKGVINLILKNENKKVSLCVSDNGIGLPDSIDFDNIDTLGLQLVKSLIEQIDGELIVNRKKGTEFIINFIAD